MIILFCGKYCVTARAMHEIAVQMHCVARRLQLCGSLGVRDEL